MCPPTREGIRGAVTILGGGDRELRPQEVMIIIMMTEITEGMTEEMIDMSGVTTGEIIMTSETMTDRVARDSMNAVEDITGMTAAMADRIPTARRTIIIDTTTGGIIGIHATTAETREITAAEINTAARIDPAAHKTPEGMIGNPLKRYLPCPHMTMTDKSLAVTETGPPAPTTTVLTRWEVCQRVCPRGRAADENNKIKRRRFQI